MPNRYVRASAIESEGVNSLTWQGEVFWRRLVNRADDFGRYTADPALVRAYVFPKQLEKVSVPDVERLLSECESAGLIARYKSGGKPCLLMGKWEKGRAKYSDYPNPPAELEKLMKDHVCTCKHVKTYVPVPDTDSDTDTDTDSGTLSTREPKPPNEPEPPAPPDLTPALALVIAGGLQAGVAPNVSEQFWLGCDARPLAASGKWTNPDGSEMRTWQSALKKFANSWANNDAQAAQRNQKPGAASGKKPGKGW